MELPYVLLPHPQFAAVGDAVLLQVSALYRRCVESVERSDVLIARSGQLIAESDRRMNGTKAVRALVRAATTSQAPIYHRIDRHSLREQVHQARAKSELISRQTRDIVARSRALLIEQPNPG